MIKKLYILVFIILFSCEKSDLVDLSGRVNFKISNLPALPSGYSYEMWIINNDETHVSLGTFSVSSEGVASRDFFDAIEVSDLESAKNIYLIIKNTTNITVSNDLVILYGSFEGDNFSMSSTHSNTIYHNASGSFELITPTTSPINQTSGIWFFKGTYPDISPSLNLNFGTSYVYQGWIKTKDSLNKDLYLDIGKFKVNNKRDDNNAFNGNLTIPEYPGQDYINNNGTVKQKFPIDLKGTDVILSVTPSTYSGSTPFGLNILTYSIPTTAVSQISYEMNKFSTEMKITGTRSY